LETGKLDSREKCGFDFIVDFKLGGRVKRIKKIIDKDKTKARQYRWLDIIPEDATSGPLAYPCAKDRRRWSP
jgi:hypothetical protein